MGDYDDKLERATRDVVVARIYAEMRAGRTTPQRRRLHQDEPPRARRRCARSSRAWSSAARDCGFDLAGGLVEVVPTAHYFMGGVVCGVDTSTELARACSSPARMPAACTAPTGSAATASPTRPCSAASPATTMPRWIAANPGHRAPDEDVLDAEMARAQHPFARKGGDFNGLRERLLDAMWDDVGVRARPRRARSRPRRARRDRGGAAGDRRRRWRAAPSI